MISWLAIATALLTLIQGLLMAIDEFSFHKMRGLRKWERIGHPIDSLFYSIPLFISAFLPASELNRVLFVGASVFSCLLITKDEFVHMRECGPSEHWVHACLFLLHPAILYGIALLWKAQEAQALRVVLPIAVTCFGFYQFFYWARKNEAAS